MILNLEKIPTENTKFMGAVQNLSILLKEAFPINFLNATK